MSKTAEMDEQRAKIESMHWFMFRFIQRNETRLVKMLKAEGYEVACPKIRRTERVGKNRNFREIVRPALRGYILVGFEMQHGAVPFRKVLEMRDVTGVVGLGSYASRIRGTEIADFLSNPRLDQRDLDRLCDKLVPDPDYVIGDAVRLCNGPFTGFEGKVVEMDKRKRRTIVSVPMMGRECPTEVGFDNAVKAE